MLAQLRVKNFRLLQDVAIDFEPGAPTVFIGPNGSGKSTVLEVLDFLSRCCNDGLAAAAAAHGGLTSIQTAGATSPVEIGITLEFSTTASSQDRSWDLDWDVALKADPSGSPVVVRESLIDRSGEQRTTLVDTDSQGVRRVHSDQGESPTTASLVKSPGKLSFEEFVDATRFRGLMHLSVLLMSTRVVGALSTAPAWARSESMVPSPRDTVVIGPKDFLDRQGVGLANVLYNLFTNHADAWSTLQQAFRGEFPFAQRIVFPPDAGGSKISFAFEDTRYVGRKFYASEMSDGMISFLCLLAASLNPNQLSILGLDEPDANLHPSALRRFMALAHQDHPKRRMALVTHSNALLDELRDPARSIRIVEPSSQGAVIRKLDAKSLAAWRNDYSLSEMRKTGLLDPSNGSSEPPE